MSRARKREARAGNLWEHLEAMEKEDRVALLDDKNEPLWEVACPRNLACWVCTQWGFPIMFNYPRFEGVPVIRVHNFHANARVIAKTSATGVWNYRDNWTMKWNRKALSEIEAIARDLLVTA